LLHGNGRFFALQLGAACIASAWAFGFTYGMLWMIDRVTPVKVDEAGEAKGLDMALHGEVAYTEAL
jgi:Amt family ammonium transporter